MVNESKIAVSALPVVQMYATGGEVVEIIVGAVASYGYVSTLGGPARRSRHTRMLAACRPF